MVLLLVACCIYYATVTCLIRLMLHDACFIIANVSSGTCCMLHVSQLIAKNCTHVAWSMFHNRSESWLIQCNVACFLFAPDLFCAAMLHVACSMLHGLGIKFSARSLALVAISFRKEIYNYLQSSYNNFY